MRKFIVIAALVLASATAQAGQSRSLTLASNDEAAVVKQQPASSEATQSSEAKPAEAPVASEAAKPAAGKSNQIVKTEKPRHRRETTEARVISELHRYGIYW